MGGFSPSISPENLNARAGCAAAPLIVDVLRADDFAVRAERESLKAENLLPPHFVSDPNRVS